MSDSYYSISQIALDDDMVERMRACTTQEMYTGSVSLITNALDWVTNNRYVWASSPGWGAAWDSALAANNPSPGKDPGVITDGMILATVQKLGNPEPAAE